MIRCPPITHQILSNLPPTDNTLWLPETRLAACVRAIMLRDTRGVVLSSEQRLNHFATAPYFGLTWFFEGSSEILVDGQMSHASSEVPRSALPGPILLMGPWDRPFVTYNPGPVRALMLVFMPDALQQLVGIDSRAWIGRCADAREVFPADWLGWLDTVLHAPSEMQALVEIEAFLTPRWALCRHAPMFRTSIEDWLQSMSSRMALSGTGRSLRQLERRIRAATGNTLRTLRRHTRDESAYLQGRERYLRGDFKWAQAAADGGYADQSHLVRENIRVTGFTPTELIRRGQTEESFWIYRLWN